MNVKLIEKTKRVKAMKERSVPQILEDVGISKETFESFDDEQRTGIRQLAHKVAVMETMQPSKKPADEVESGSEKG